MLSQTHESWKHVVGSLQESLSTTASPHPRALFTQQPLSDALADLAAIVQCLCDRHEEHYGITLLHNIVRDTLIHLASRAALQEPKNPMD